MTDTWRKYLTDYNEGLGLVYERFVLNDFLAALREQYDITVRARGATVRHGRRKRHQQRRPGAAGCPVTLVDDTPERLDGVQRIWRTICNLPAELVCIPPTRWSSLPFADRSFDLTWHWAGLWYIADPAGLLRELVRVSRNLVFVAMPNHLQVGYWMRKLVIDREFFVTHDETLDRHGAHPPACSKARGVEIIDQGVLDVPPWPDTVMPANEVLKRLGIRSQAARRPVHRRRLAVEHHGLLSGRAAGTVRPGDALCLARPRCRCPGRSRRCGPIIATCFAGSSSEFAAGRARSGAKFDTKFDTARGTLYTAPLPLIDDVCSDRSLVLSCSDRLRASWRKNRMWSGPLGGMAERTKAVVLKTTVAAMSPGVRIPLPPPDGSSAQVGGGRIARSSAPAC